MATHSTETPDLAPNGVDPNEPLLEIPAEAEPETEAASTSEDDTEQQEKSFATDLGWVPEDQWRGHGQWVDHKTFLRRHQLREPQRLKRDNQTLRTELEQMRSELAEVRAAQQAQAEARADIQHRTLMAERAAALAEQDYERATRIDDQLLDLKVAAKTAAVPRPSSPTAVPPHVKAAVEEFGARYPIFSSDPRMGRALGVEVGQLQHVAALAHQQVDPGELLEEAAQNVMSRFPAKFQRAAPRPAMTEMNGTPARQATKRGWGDLVPEARTELDNMIRTTPTLNSLGIEKARAEVLKNADDSYFRK